MFVSKFDHCLGDLLYRMRIGELAMDVVGIISNHPEGKAESHDVRRHPYHHLPITPETKLQQEAEVRRHHRGKRRGAGGAPPATCRYCRTG
jgi:formyltetrahydrofolate deformylase